MPTQDYWGDFQVTDEQRTPVQILKEQASVLNEKVGHCIRALVATSALPEGTPKFRSAPPELTPKFRSTLAVIVPSLDRYRLDIVTITYPLRAYYPLALSDDLAEGKEALVEVEFRCQNEREFRSALYQILSSTRTTDTLNSLLSLAA